MSWMQKFSRHVNGAHSDNKVIQVDNNNYHAKCVHCREESIILYLPNDGEQYEVVLHLPATESLSKSFSLFRSNSLNAAENRFSIFKHKISLICEICPSLTCNEQTIQSMCNMLEENPTLNVAHIAAFFALFDVIDNRKVKPFLNISDSNGTSPLQAAVSSKNLTMVKKLLSNNCAIDHLDFKKNSVLHFAADTTPNILTAILSQYSDNINQRNVKGYTPIFIACNSGALECMKVLINYGADPCTKCIGDDKVVRGTALHFCLNNNVLKECLRHVTNNKIINTLNENGETALHVMVNGQIYDNILCLLIRLANINIPDKDGNTPLHLAIKQSNLKIVQLLLAFSADVNALNKNMESPCHMLKLDSANGYNILYLLSSIGANRCSDQVSNCHDGCKAKGTEQGYPPTDMRLTEPETILDQMLYVQTMADFASSRSKTHGKGGRLLCLDGGGIKGLVLIQMLMEIEAILGKPINKCFDWIAGTSTGGILALALALGKDLRECLSLYLEIKDNTFVGKRPYKAKVLEESLMNAFGKDTVMSDITDTKVIVTGVLADRRPVDLHLFRNYDSPSDILRQSKESGDTSKFEDTLRPQEQLVWKAARASGAAPTYFPKFGRFIDGGLISNNPTLDAMTEIYEYNIALNATEGPQRTTPLSLVVSLGTGLIPVTPQKIDITWEQPILSAITSVMKLMNLVVDQATTTDGRVVNRARAWCSMIGVPYFRFNPQLLKEIELDEKDNELLIEMMWVTKVYMHTHRRQLLELASVFATISE